eukprot:5945574-Lingulodinium_polyedra.AAC.1
MRHMMPAAARAVRRLGIDIAAGKRRRKPTRNARWKSFVLRRAKVRATAVQKGYGAVFYAGVAPSLSFGCENGRLDPGHLRK